MTSRRRPSTSAPRPVVGDRPLVAPRVLVAARLLVAGLLVLVGLLGVAPASAAGVTLELTASGPADGAVVAAEAGDTVVIVNGDSIDHRVEATSGGWSLSPGTLAPGESTSPVVLGAAGDYVFTDSSLRQLVGSREVTVRAAAAPTPTPSATTPSSSGGGGSTTPTGSSADGTSSTAPGAGSTSTTPAQRAALAAEKAAAEKAAAEKAAEQKAAERRAAKKAAAEKAAEQKAAAEKAAAEKAVRASATAASSVGGTGLALQPLLGSATLPGAGAAAGGPAPALAPDLAVDDPALLLSQGDPSAGVSGLGDDQVLAASSGSLAGPPTGRRLGLPVTVALVALLGAGSLVVRVLLAEPVAAAARPAAA